MRARRRIFGGVAATALGACSALYPVQIERTGARGTPQDEAHVEVLSEPPARPFVEIARLMTDSVNYDSPGHAVEVLRSAAAKEGADAIIVERRGMRPAHVAYPGATNERDFGFVPSAVGPPEVTGGYTLSSFARCVAIRWTTPEPEQRALRAVPALNAGARPEAAEAAKPSSDIPFFNVPVASRPASRPAR